MNLTFGYELELGDISRARLVPEEFGTWEYAETDIVNLMPPYRHIAVDPLGKEPPSGGEINIRPGHSVEEVAERVSACIEWFRGQGDDPTTSCVNHGHVHVRVIGLRDDIVRLKRFITWIKANQLELIERAYGYKECFGMVNTKTARTYLRWDGGRPMPDWMADNILKKANSFGDFIDLQCCGKDGKSRGRPFRYAVNTYCMKHIDTIELRCLRASLDHEAILGSLRLARDIIVEGCSGGNVSIGELWTANKYVVPKFEYDHLAYLGWEKTKWSKERGKKQRVLLDV